MQKTQKFKKQPNKWNICALDGLWQEMISTASQSAMQMWTGQCTSVLAIHNGICSAKGAVSYNWLRGGICMQVSLPLS